MKNHCQCKKILIVKDRGMGDAIIGLSALSYLKTLNSNCGITYAIPDWVAPIFQKNTTEAEEIYPLNLKSLKGVLAFISFLKKEKFEMIIELHQSGKTKKIFSLFKYFFKFQYYFHNHHCKNETMILDQGKTKPIIQRDLDAIFSIYFSKDCLTPGPPSYLDYPPQIKISRTKKNEVVLGVVATRETKLWPLQYFAELMNLIPQHNSQIHFIIPLSKNALDQRIFEEFQQLMINASYEFLFLNLAELPVRLSQACFYVGNDTGLKHLCVALGLKTLTFFGPEWPQEWHPYDKVNHPYFFHDPLACRTELDTFCPLSTCKSMECLKRIHPQEVKTFFIQNFLQN